jgi:ABC-type lipoprotein release transport system permease subunit
MEIDLKIAWRNLWRNPRRSLLTLAAIAFASVLLIFMLSWQLGSYDTMINASVRIQTGHLQVQAAGYEEKKEIWRVVEDPSRVAAVLADTAGVAAYSFRASAFSLVSSRERTYGVLVRGLDPGRETAVSSVAQTVREGRFLAAGDATGAVVGALLARNLKVGLGDELVVMGQARDGSIAAAVLNVVGIFSSGQDDLDRGVLQMPLQTFQEAFAMDGAVHAVVVRCDDLEAVASVKAAVAGALGAAGAERELAVLDWMALMPGLVQSIQLDLVSGVIFYLILVVVVAFSILNTFLMAVFERTREFGVFMALGTSPARLVRMLMLESAVMTLTGTLVGIFLGVLLTAYFQRHGIVIPGAADLLAQYGLPARMHPKLSWLSVFIGPLVVAVLTLLTALYPALRVRRLKPAAAMRAV